MNRALLTCDLVEHHLVRNLLSHTNGRLTLKVSSFPELGISGQDAHRLLSTGVLEMVALFSPYVSADSLKMDIFNLYGLYEDRTQVYQATVELIPEAERLLAGQTEGYPLNVNWHNGGDDLYFISKRPLHNLEDMQGLKAWGYGAPLSNWLKGMGTEQFDVPFVEMYSILERSILEAAITNGIAAYFQGCYELSNFIAGPVVAWPVSHNVVNAEV